jgi:hypothetical protein
MNVPEMPFTILALAPFMPVPEPPGFPSGNRGAYVVPVETVNDALRTLAPSFRLTVPKELCPEGSVTYCPARVRDLSPDGMVECVPYLKSLNDARGFIEKGIAQGVSALDLADGLKGQWPYLPLDLSFEPAVPQTERDTVLDDIFSMVATKGPQRAAPMAGAGPMEWKRQIDGLLARLLESLYGNESFRVFEAAWRGLETIMKKGPAGGSHTTHVAIVPVSVGDLASTLDAIAERSASEPPGLVLVDLPFDNSIVSIDLLEKVALFAQDVLTPVVAWMTPRFLNLESWRDLHRLPYLKTHLENAAYAKWKKLCSGPGGQWLAIACNRFLARSPYGEEPQPQTLVFRENAVPWVSPVWAVGALAAQSTERYGWPSRFTDTENIRLDDLGLIPYEGEGRASTEAVIPVDRIRQFGEIGITVLSGTAMKDLAFVSSAKTVSGESLPFQIFFSRLVGALIRLRELTGMDAGMDDAELRLKEALSVFFRQTGGDPPPDLSVQFLETNDGWTVKIGFTPPRSALPGSGRFVFDFSW